MQRSSRHRFHAPPRLPGERPLGWGRAAAGTAGPRLWSPPPTWPCTRPVTLGNVRGSMPEAMYERHAHSSFS